jgi:hypothetical protein
MSDLYYEFINFPFFDYIHIKQEYKNYYIAEYDSYIDTWYFRHQGDIFVDTVEMPKKLGDLSGKLIRSIIKSGKIKKSLLDKFDEYKVHSKKYALMLLKNNDLKTIELNEQNSMLDIRYKNINTFKA